MVLVASSRSAKTALPSEQNQPGRRLAQAAQPMGDGRAVCLIFEFSSSEICASAIVLPISCRRGPWPPPFSSLVYFAQLERSGCPSDFHKDGTQSEFA